MRYEWTAHEGIIGVLIFRVLLFGRNELGLAAIECYAKNEDLTYDI